MEENVYLLWLTKTKEFIERVGWHSPWTLGLVESTLLVGYLSVNGRHLWRYFSSEVRMGCLALLLGLAALAWAYHRYHLNRTSDGKIGIMIAIFAESREEEMRLKTDFVMRMRSAVSGPEFSGLFDVVVAKNHQAKKFRNSKWLQKNKRRLGAVLYLTGEVRKRLDGHAKYFIDLDGTVCHKNIPAPVSRELCADFLSVLPKRLTFSEMYQFRGYELTADICAFAAVFISGCAALLSEAPRVALMLHERIAVMPHPLEGTPMLRRMRARLKLYIFDEKISIAREGYKAGRFEEAREWCLSALGDATDPYPAYLLLGILEFQEGRIESSLDAIRKARQRSKGRVEWLYSIIFLYFWTENYHQALTEIGKLKTYDLTRSVDTSTEVRSFVLELLKNDTEKPQLYYWLSVLELIAFKDKAQSRVYLLNFLNAAGPSALSLRAKAEALLQTL